MERRIFDLDIRKLINNCRINTPSSLYLNFFQHLSYAHKGLNGNYDENALKLYLADTGLLVSLLDEEAQDDLRANRNLNVYKGALYENVVADALVKSGYNLFYYKRQNPSIEEDFFLRTANELVPLEVKASNDKARSLSKLIQSDNYPEIKFGIKLVKGNIGVDSNILTFPHFCAFLLKRLLKDKRLYNLIKI